MITGLIYGLDSPTLASCALPNGVAGQLVVPATVDPVLLQRLRAAHIFAEYSAAFPES